MHKIQILPPDLINQIAAGEVVERPASVVKELVENAIDAGATRIAISAKDGGRILRIADNGCGMSRDDLEIAFRNHATSKVRDLDDLFEIRTLGFRGEALASIAAIAKLTCVSRTPEAPHGLKAKVYPSGDVELQETGAAVGTTMVVEDLFYNVPARLKFLRRPQTELAHVHELLQMLALSHPEIAFELKLEASIALKTTGSGDLAKAIQEVFSLGEADTLLPFAFEDETFGYRAWGQTSTPDVTRSSKKWMMTFINGRALRCPVLGKAVESAYASMAVPGKYPITVLFLEMPYGEVDVNVHPAKREVRYQKANLLFSFVRKAIENALSTLMTSEAQIHGGYLSKYPRGQSTRAVSSGGYTPKIPADVTASMSQKETSASWPFVPGRMEYPSVRETSASTQEVMALYAPLSGQDADISVSNSDHRVIGQLAKTYILLETPDGLLVVDQHIASERVLFEQFSEQAERVEPVSQPLLVPYCFTVSPAQAAVLHENREAFLALGFDYVFEDVAVVQFLQVPALYSEKTVKQVLEGLLHHLEQTGEVKLSITDVIATSACHSAVRAGDFLTQAQMERVIAQWQACHRPWTCPHGRPVSHTVSHAELMGYFDRPSLPATR